MQNSSQRLRIRRSHLELPDILRHPPTPPPSLPLRSGTHNYLSAALYSPLTRLFPTSMSRNSLDPFFGGGRGVRRGVVRYATDDATPQRVK